MFLIILASVWAQNCDDDGSFFKCEQSGVCIDINWKCDGEPDCPHDGSDEIDCPNQDIEEQATTPR